MLRSLGVALLCWFSLQCSGRDAPGPKTWSLEGPSTFEERTMIRLGAALWNAACGPGMLTELPTGGQYKVLSIHDEERRQEISKGLSKDHPQLKDNPLAGATMYGPRTVELYLDQTDPYYVPVIAHEFGHVLGLPDLMKDTHGESLEGKALMYGIASLEVVWPTPVDLAALRALGVTCD